MADIQTNTYKFTDHREPIHTHIDDFYLVSDLHLMHNNILKYEPCRQVLGSNGVEMTLALIDLWNDTVKETDNVLFLGDFAMTSAKRILELAGRLNGNKHMIMGNHDRGKSKTFWKQAFNYVFENPIRVGNIIYSHEPVSPAYIDKYECSINVHGHLHSKKIEDGRHTCVSVEQTEFRPIKLIKEIL